MPRKTRIDAPCALHHIIVGGIERRRIFSDDQDRDNFVDRLGNIVAATQSLCFANELSPIRAFKDRDRKFFRTSLTNPHI